MQPSRLLWHNFRNGDQERSFDHLIGAGDEGRWDVEADGGGGFQVDDQLEFGGQLDRQIGRLGALEDAVRARVNQPGEEMIKARFLDCASVRVAETLGAGDVTPRALGAVIDTG
jgi:hypothetical protein